MNLLAQSVDHKTLCLSFFLGIPQHMRALYAFGINKKYIPLKENPFHEMVVRADTKFKKTLDDQQMEKVY
ncbi:hypothetical protein MA092_002990, partial [Salmonella enterica]|nr:hypothetical protein [Salmonella enterica]